MASLNNHTHFHHLLIIHLHILFFLLIIITQFPLPSRCCHEEDRSALLNFKFSLDDSTNHLSSWQKGRQHENCCSWHGIRCSNDSLRVISIYLRNTDLEDYYNKQSDYTTADASDPPSTALTGIFPAASLIKVTHLEYLDLAFNDFQESQIPRQYYELTSLTHLDLSNCNLAASISIQFSNLSSLQYLDLSCTSDYFFTSCLQTSSTKWVRGLVNLKVLRLSGIDVYEATSSQKNFSAHISNLSNLRELDLSYCNISTPLFPIHEFHNLSHLSSLKMNRNYQLNSLIPAELGNVASLSTLELSNCQLHGSVPYLPKLKELDVNGNGDLHVDLNRMLKRHWPKLQTLKISNTVVNGSFPSSFSNAPFLVILYASSCYIQGPLPSSLYNLSHLKILDLSYNSITGFIHPSISNLKILRYLDLSFNSFQGSMPESICQNSPLEVLRLDTNNLTTTIPSCISQLQNLRHFTASGNFIEVCNLTNLEELDVSQNSLTGTIPSCLFKLKYLRKINVGENKLHGLVSLPPQGIQEFDLSNNKFSGEISLELGKRLSQATTIDLGGNELSGSIPFTLCPTEPGLFTSTSFIDLSKNKLSGTIPSNIGYCGYLEALKLGNNNLTGKVPNELKLAQHLSFLQLNNNHLDGTPLTLISELYRLEFLNLANNNFEGSIPPALGLLQDLRFLSLRSNKFNRSIPEEIIHLQNLQLLDLSLNNFSGHIPKNLENLIGLRDNSYVSPENHGDVQLDVAIKGIMIEMKKLYDYSSVIDLSSNNLDGNIPEEIGLLKLLFSLNLSHNLFTGDIPESIADLSGLQSLDLSSNKLSGHIPQALTTIDSLAVINLSSNNLSGRIPREPHFDTLSLDGSAFSGNDLLCGFPTQKLCEGNHNTSTSEANPSNKFDEVDREDAKEKLLLYAIASLGLGVGFWGMFIVLYLKKLKWWFPYWKFVDSIAVRIIDSIQKN
ncbi:hypothetical protein MKW92_006104 [Papaver armeniacum]|nr:hypothetical protein MKW92_006104 [Papaver armeniacum]